LLYSARSRPPSHSPPLPVSSPITQAVSLIFGTFCERGALAVVFADPGAQSYWWDASYGPGGLHVRGTAPENPCLLTCEFVLDTVPGGTR
jgi:hypothetical protein